MFEVLLLSLFVLPGASSWDFFDVYEGESLEYDICDHLFQDSYTSQRGLCYTVELKIENIISANEKQFYFVSANFSHDDTSTDRLFLIDGTDYTINPIFIKDRDYAESLQDTLFWRNWGNTINTTHGASTINLQENDDTTTLIISDSIIAENGLYQYTAKHDNFEISHFTINDGIPLPISAGIFTPGGTPDTVLPVFSFELINHVNDNAETGYGLTFPEIIYGNGLSTEIIYGNGLSTEIIYGNRLAFPEITNSHYEVEWK